jgi:hypothetical protein
MTVDGIRYRPTATQVIAEPVAVIWSPAGCDEEPPVDPEFAIATRCPTSNPVDLTAPAQVVYAVNPGVGVGNGTVNFPVQFDGPDCPPPQAPVRCVRLVRYLPTSTPSDGPADLGVTHAAGVTCAPNQTICQECEDIVAPAMMAPGDFQDGAAFYAEQEAEEAAGEQVPEQGARLAAVARVSSMAAGFTRSMISGRHADDATVATRQRSCFGDPDAGVPACPSLRGEEGRRYCGSCGCGDRRMALLDADQHGQSKLRFTYLTCPRRRPGFSNAKDET